MSHVSAVSSCTHSAWQHLLHPFCTSLPLWRRVAVVAIPVLAVAIVWASLRRPPEMIWGVDVSRLSKAQREAFAAAQKAYAQLPLDVTREIDELIALLDSNSWDSPEVKSKAKKTLQITYVNIYLNLNKSNPGENVESDWINLYHAIRSHGIIERNQDGSLICLGGNQNSYDESSAELYNSLTPMLKDKYANVSNALSYLCLLTPFQPGSITPKMRGVIDDLLGGTYTIDSLPDYSGNFPPTALQMSNWIMKGVHEGKPFVAIKMLCSIGLENIVFLSYKNTRDNWLQLDVYGSGRPFSNFFSKEDSNDLLKTIIKEGRGFDKNGMEWAIVDHPAHNAAAPITKAPPADDGISQVVRNVFKDHLGINVDTLPVLENYKEELPNPEDLNAPIMKFTSKGSNHPNIAIKLRCENENATSLLILGKNQNDNRWIQYQSVDLQLHTRFLIDGQFTDEQGTLVAPPNSIAELKNILTGKEGTAINNYVWKLAE